MELKQLGSAVAFRDGNDHIMVKRDTSFGLTVKIPVGLERREIAFFVVHADERHKKHTIKGNVRGTVPVFRIKDTKGLKIKFVRCSEFGRVVARIGSVPIGTRELVFTAVFHVSSSDKVSSGNRHSLRQWNFITCLKGCSESKWKLLQSLPVQVYKEITGASRDPGLRKRKKRSTTNDRISVTNGQCYMRYVEKPVTSVGIDVLKEIITPRVEFN